MTPAEIPASALKRRAVVYVRQSTAGQVQENLESQRRQYALADLARGYGFQDVCVIDEDLGRSGSGTAPRPGFEGLVSQLCRGEVGAVFCLEVSRLARNGRDWHHVLEVCGMVGALVVDGDGIHDPARPSDRLVLGLKGTMSEFELTLIRRRLVEGAQAKAQRGELRISVPLGYQWSRETGLDMTPDLRIQDAIRTVFDLFEQLGSAHRVLRRLRAEGLSFPGPADGKQVTRTLIWKAPTYRSIHSVLTNPFYAGAYAYGKSAVETEMADGRLRKRYGRRRPMSEWSTLIQGHHRSYISWETFERNQLQLSRNNYGKPAGGAKAARGGTALLGGLLLCRRCGRRLAVLYGGHGVGHPRYSCNRGERQGGLPRCISFGASRPDDEVARQILAAVQPLALEAAIAAERDAAAANAERRRALELERQAAEYEVRLAARRYEAVDPDNRLVALELEKRWEDALSKLRAVESHQAAQIDRAPTEVPDRGRLLELAADLEAVWSAPTTLAADRQRLVRALVEDIVVDVDEGTREVVLVVHWKGGQHSEVRVRKPGTGEHRRRASKEAEALISSMSARWSDEHIAATLNRMGLRTGQGKPWNAVRVGAWRRTHGIAGYASAPGQDACLTMRDAAAAAGVSAHAIRRLIATGVLPAHQVMLDAPWQIRREDLESEAVRKAIQARPGRGQRPCRNSPASGTLEIPWISTSGAE